ncbi:hypothetical protein L0F63_005816, partial [Massospora cicadina]
GYATSESKPQKSQKGKTSLGGDSRNDIICRSLFDAPLRDNLELTEIEIEQDRVINMAWDLYTNEKREAHLQQLKIKYLRMVDASNALIALSPELFKTTLRKEPSTDIFPNQLKIPTLTPGNTIWNYKSQTKVDSEAAAAKELKCEKKF